MPEILLILFPLNILRQNWWNLTLFIYIGKIWVEIVTCQFLQF